MSHVHFPGVGAGDWCEDLCNGVLFMKWHELKGELKGTEVVKR